MLKLLKELRQLLDKFRLLRAATVASKSMQGEIEVHVSMIEANIRAVERLVGQADREPPESILKDGQFNAILDRIKTWDIDDGQGPSAATGNHAYAILLAINDYQMSCCVMKTPPHTPLPKEFS